MFITNIIDDYNVTLSKNNNCTNNDNNNTEIILPFFMIIPCSLSFLCLMSFMVYNLIKPLINKKRWKKFYTQLIQFAVL